MSWRGRSVLAVIPARGGSKGIPRKNLQEVGGIPLVARAARAARALGWIDCAMLSTDDEEIAEVGRREGLEVPGLRPAALAGDRAGALETWRHAWAAAEDARGERFELSVLLEPTSPLRRLEDVERTVRALVERGTRSAMTVSRNPGHFTPERTLRVDEDQRIRPYLPDGFSHTARQAIPPYYHRNGVAYATTRAALLDPAGTPWDDCAAVVVEGPMANVDESIDLEWAEFLLARGGTGRGA